jgi:hypothetical protein
VGVALGPAVGPGQDEFEQESRLAVEALLGALPELGPLVEELADEFGDEPSAQCVFAELAGVTSHLFGDGPDLEDEERLERIFAAVEHVATTPGVDTTATVAFSFLDGLDPGALTRAYSYLGPATEEILERLLGDELAIGEDDW